MDNQTFLGGFLQEDSWSHHHSGSWWGRSSVSPPGEGSGQCITYTQKMRHAALFNRKENEEEGKSLSKAAIRLSLMKIHLRLQNEDSVCFSSADNEKYRKSLYLPFCHSCQEVHSSFSYLAEVTTFTWVTAILPALSWFLTSWVYFELSSSA